MDDSKFYCFHGYYSYLGLENIEQRGPFATAVVLYGRAMIPILVPVCESPMSLIFRWAIIQLTRYRINMGGYEALGR